MDKSKQQIIKSGLYIVSTPIGNMEDITFRAINILKKSDIILCEDTRRSVKLLQHFQIKNKLFPYHQFNEKKVLTKIVESIKNNKIISLISDAGTPTISDPGRILVNKCIEENLTINTIPGPSAVTSAICVSGFSDKYFFYGFLSKKENELQILFKKFSNFEHAIVFFIPSLKINFYISQFKKYFSDRQIMIAKEMTKIHEEYVREKVNDIEDFKNNIKGELTVVISEKIKQKNIKQEVNESVKIEIKKMLKKYSLKDVVEFISKKENLSKKLIYNYSLKSKK